MIALITRTLVPSMLVPVAMISWLASDVAAGIVIVAWNAPFPSAVTSTRWVTTEARSIPTGEPGRKHSPLAVTESPGDATDVPSARPIPFGGYRSRQAFFWGGGGGGNTQVTVAEP